MAFLALVVAEAIANPIELDAAGASGGTSMRFEPNVGQVDARADFLARGRRYDIYLTGPEAALVLRDGRTPSTLRVRPLGRRTRLSAVKGVEPLPSHSNYFRGSDPRAWQRGVPHFARILCENVYDGIDLLYYGTEGELEYDFVIHPGARPGVIAMTFEGARVRADGPELVLSLPNGGEVRQRAPHAYQTIAGRRREVASAYRLTGGIVRFAVGPYDQGYPLIIDPVLSYATYLGGGAGDNATDVAVNNADGSVYVVGNTSSTNFPVAAARQPANAGQQDAFVSKFHRNGTALLYSTYFGGSNIDSIAAVAIDASGAVFVTGTSRSVNFPTTAGAFRPTIPNQLGFNAYVAKFSDDGLQLLYSTFIAEGPVNDIAVDLAGQAHITGSSSNFVATTGAYDTTPPTSSVDAFVTKVSANGGALVYSTYLGADKTSSVSGTFTDSGLAIAIDKAGQAVVVGETRSSNFPTTAGAYRTTPAGHDDGFEANFDAFAAKFNVTGTALVYSTYLGGSSFDRANDVAIDDQGSVYVGGSTSSANFPTTSGVYSTALGSGFVTKMNSTGSGLVYSTFFPATVETLAIHEGVPYVAGATSSTAFPVVAPHQAAIGGLSDAYLSVLNRTGAVLTYSTYLGGTSHDGASALFVDASANAYIVGSTSSTNFPTLTPVQAAQGGSGDGFLARITFDADGDGLLDVWEEQGIDVNGDGTIDLDLPGLGAQKNHKDIFVEIDYMVAPDHTHRPDYRPDGLPLQNGALQRVVDAFAAAPVTNPDNLNGIKLHILPDEAIAELTPLSFDPANSDFNRIKYGSPANPCGSGHFGLPGDRSSPNCVNILAARRRVYHYTLFVHEHAGDPNSSGVAEFIGNDVVVALRVRVPGADNDFEDRVMSRAATFGTTFDHEWADSVSATFMHELGHNLGLHHGGGIALPVSQQLVNLKPNYLSIMNYALQFNVQLSSTTSPPTAVRTNRPLDYSRSTLAALNEASLNENVGVGGPAGRFTMYGVGTSGLARIASTQGPIDWNGQNGLEAAVSSDINRIGFGGQTPPATPGEILLSHDDWPNLVYNFRGGRDYADGADFQTVPPEEITLDFEPGPAPPTAAIDAPSPGQTFAAPATITIEVTATASDGAMQRVDFYQGETLVGTDSEAPYAFAWNDVPAGSYSLSARAVDAFGLVGISSATAIRVGNCSSPVVTIEPLDQTVEQNTSATLQVAVTGSATLSYQWYRGTEGVVSNPVSGATSATLLLPAEATNMYWVRITNSCGSDDSRVATVTVVPASAPGTPGPLVATAAGATVGLLWGTATSAAYYAVERQEAGFTFRPIATVSSPTTAFTDAGCPGGSTCVYRVRALDSSGGRPSGYSNHDLATRMAFTAVDIGGTISADHFVQLLAGVNAVRAAAGMAAVTWAQILPGGATPPVTGGYVQAAHITTLRATLDGAMQANGVAIQPYSDGGLTAGYIVRAAHVRELQDRTK